MFTQQTVGGPTMGGEATLAVNNVKKIWGEETQVVTP